MKSIISICTSYVIYNAQQQRKYIYMYIGGGQTSPQYIGGGPNLTPTYNIPGGCIPLPLYQYLCTSESL